MAVCDGAVSLPTGTDQDALVRELERLARGGRVFYLVTDDPVRYRIGLLAGEQPPASLDRTFERSGGAFAIELPGGAATVHGWSREGVPVLAGSVDCTPGRHALSVLARRPFDGSRYVEEMRALLGSEWTYMERVNRLGLVGWLPLLATVITLVARKWSGRTHGAGGRASEAALRVQHLADGAGRAARRVLAGLTAGLAGLARSDSLDVDANLRGTLKRRAEAMDIVDQPMLWRQFGAAIDMLGDALRDCPDDLWETRLWEDEADQWVAAGFSTFWYLGYHTLFWLDLYLTGAEEGFAPPAPFDLVEMRPGEALPRTYTRAELLRYLEYSRRKCQETIGALSTDRAHRLCRFAWGELPFAELQLYNLRHVQEHGAQLRMFLGAQAGRSARWVARAR